MRVDVVFGLLVASPLLCVRRDWKGLGVAGVGECSCVTENVYFYFLFCLDNHLYKLFANRLQ